jgi:hypothetical protein
MWRKNLNTIPACFRYVIPNMGLFSIQSAVYVYLILILASIGKLSFFHIRLLLFSKHDH